MRCLKFLVLFPFVNIAFCQETQETPEALETVENQAVQEQQSKADSSITGFYGGTDLGMDFLKQKSRNNLTRASKNKTKSGMTLDAFVGYNVQFGDFIFGLEGSLDFRTASPKVSIDGKNFSLKRKYSFGISPKIGYNIYNNLNGYVNFGTLTSKYKVRGNGDKSNPTKTAMFVGLGLEQSFGTMFVRGELNRVFKKTVSKLNNVNMSADSYTFKIGGGYRF